MYERKEPAKILVGSMGAWSKTKIIALEDFDVKKLPPLQSKIEWIEIEGKKYAKLTYGLDIE